MMYFHGERRKTSSAPLLMGDDRARVLGCAYFVLSICVPFAFFVHHLLRPPHVIRQFRSSSLTQRKSGAAQICEVRERPETTLQKCARAPKGHSSFKNRLRTRLHGVASASSRYSKGRFRNIATREEIFDWPCKWLLHDYIQHGETDMADIVAVPMQFHEGP